MGSDGVILGDNLPEDVGMPAHVLADREKRRLQALRRQGCQHGGRIAGPRAVVEGQHDLARFEEIVGLELIGAEAGPARRVDLHRTVDSQRVGIFAPPVGGGGLGLRARHHRSCGPGRRRGRRARRGG